MPEDDTTLIERTKSLAQKHPKKTVAGVSAATLVAVYSLFVTQTVFNAHQNNVKESAAAQWRALKDLENKVDAVRMDVIRLQERAILTSTNR